MVCDDCNEEISLYPFNKFFPIDDVVWLPRQDQLQKMASLLCNYNTQILKFLNDWIKDNKIPISDYRSMEQLWLAFVMHTVYNKTWGSLGNRWIELP
jgi:hypothetical protein